LAQFRFGESFGLSQELAILAFTKRVWGVFKLSQQLEAFLHLAYDGEVVIFQGLVVGVGVYPGSIELLVT
jgi:hypothetical protein